MTLSLGFSPCPNDTFIFDALVNRKIDTGGINFNIFLEDVETLNSWALQGKLDITKLSFPAFFQSLGNYLLLSSGSALGKGVGPLLIAKGEAFGSEDIISKSIAIPGIHTTANLLLSFCYPQAKKKNPILFSEIEDHVLSGRSDLGVIIHENRFTYAQRGLYKISDLGEYWEQQTGQPIPLGGIVARREMDPKLIRKIEQLIRQSLSYAFANYPIVSGYVREHAQSMDESVMRQHIELYVNNYSLDLGIGGRKAIKTLFEVYQKSQKKSTRVVDLFS